MSDDITAREPMRPAVLSLARPGAALKDAKRRLRRWPRERTRPSLTAAPRLAFGCSGRDEKTALQPNQKTERALEGSRTTHALQKADIFTWHRHYPLALEIGIPAGGGLRPGTNLLPAVPVGSDADGGSNRGIEHPPNIRPPAPS